LLFKLIKEQAGCSGILIAFSIPQRHLLSKRDGHIELRIDDINYKEGNKIYLVYVDIE